MLFSGLGSLALMQPDEGRNAEVAREMAATNSWLVPTLEGHPYLDKPAAYFTAVALSLRVVGVNEWGARLPSALCGLGILVLLYAFTRQRYDPATAALVVLVVSTSPLVLAFSRIVIMDIALAICTTAAILAAYVAEEDAQPDRRWHAAGAAAAGVGTLVKGPVGALVPAVVLAVFFWADGRPRALRRVFAPWNVLIVLGLVVPWFLGLARAHPEFVHYGLVEESFNRFFTPTFHRGQPFWFFGPVFLETLMPWSILCVPMAWAAWTERRRLTPVDRLFVTWTIVVLVFFSMSRTKQPGYILTGVVAAGVLVGRGLGYAWHNRQGRAARLVARGALALAAFAIVGVGVLNWSATHSAETGSTASKNGWIELVRPQLLAVLAATAVLGVASFRRRRIGLTVAAFVLVPMSVVTVVLPGAEAYANGRSAKPLAAGLASLSPGTEIACLGSYPAGLSFYLRRTVTIIDDDAAPLRSNFVTYWLRRLPERPATLVASEARDPWLQARAGDVMILASAATRNELEAWIGGRAPVHALAYGWWGALVPRPAER
jgi:4-amino-4-deoxy-L-arabinose transferase-like glycosyltransferase